MHFRAKMTIRCGVPQTFSSEKRFAPFHPQGKREFHFIANYTVSIGSFRAIYQFICPGGLRSEPTHGSCGLHQQIAQNCQI